jgi:hypothetical protein
MEEVRCEWVVVNGSYPLPVPGEGRVREFLWIAPLALTPTLSPNGERE